MGIYRDQIKKIALYKSGNYSKRNFLQAVQSGIFTLLAYCFNCTVYIYTLAFCFNCTLTNVAALG